MGGFIALDTTGRKMNKFGNKKTEIDGIVFDSKHEANRWIELRYMERAKLIKNLRRQVKYTLIGSQCDADKKVIERPVTYIADFVYVDENGNTVVEDAKSTATRTDAYKIKRKLMLMIYGIRIKEV